MNWINHNRFKCREQEHSALKITLNDVFLFFFGNACTELLVDTAKFTIGRHRPNFIAACGPQVEAYDAQTAMTKWVECQTVPHLQNAYIDVYKCSKVVSKDINLSFFSGHSALMAYTAVFLSILLAQRLRKNVESTMGRLIVAMLIVFEIDLAFFVGLTRISDYMHHPTDVAIGFLVGTLVAIFIKLFLDKTKCNNEDNELDRPRTVQLSEFSKLSLH